MISQAEPPVRDRFEPAFAAAAGTTRASPTMMAGMITLRKVDTIIAWSSLPKTWRPPIAADRCPTVSEGQHGDGGAATLL